MVTKADPDHHRVAVLIAKFIKGELKGMEEKELDDWILEDDDNMELFEKLTNDYHIEWSRTWFAERGIKTGFLKDKSGGWYKPKPDPKDLRSFYIGIAIGVVGMLFIYFVLHYL